MKRLMILMLMIGCVSAYTIELNLTGSMSPLYPMLFVDCNGDCNDWNVTHTVRNHTSQFFKVIDKDILFLELSGMTEATPILVQAERLYTPYTAFPLNLDTTDFLSSTTISLSSTTEARRLLFPADRLMEGSMLEEAYRFPTVRELLDM